MRRPGFVLAPVLAVAVGSGLLFATGAFTGDPYASHVSSGSAAGSAKSSGTGTTVAAGYASRGAAGTHRAGGAGGFRTLSTDGLPADCVPNPVGPPGAPYQLGLVGTVSGGTLQTGAATVANVNATFCGIVTLVNGTPPCRVTGQVVSPGDGQVFGSLSVQLTLVPGMTPAIGFAPQPGVITGGFSCAPSQNGLAITANATVSGATAPVFGVSCTIGPLTIPLDGVITGPFTDLKATLTSRDFSVPAIEGSPTCPAGVPSAVDAIAGLPIAPGGATAVLPVTASLYLPGP